MPKICLFSIAQNNTIFFRNYQRLYGGCIYIPLNKFRIFFKLKTMLKSKVYYIRECFPQILTRLYLCVGGFGCVLVGLRQGFESLVLLIVIILILSSNIDMQGPHVRKKNIHVFFEKITSPCVSC
jgi:hypothetical protein